MLSCIYLTRKCPHRCHYCRIVDSDLYGDDLTVDQWKKAFTILKSRDVRFHLILGNEPLLYDGIVELMDWLTNVDKTPYAFYTTATRLYADKAKQLASIPLSNISTGFDYFPVSSEGMPSITHPDYFAIRKSSWGFEGLQQFQDAGTPDLHGTITVTRWNKDIVVDLLKFLTRRGMWSAVNPVHWDKDGGFDFFPPRSVLAEDVLTQAEIVLLMDEILAEIYAGTVSVQNPPEYFEEWKKYGAEMDWHCNLPLIYSVDCDGSMRCCGYRRGNAATSLSVFDLALDEGDTAYWNTWRQDSSKCPGCFWSYWWQAEKQLTRKDDEEDFGHRFFQVHANEFYTFDE